MSFDPTGRASLPQSTYDGVAPGGTIRVEQYLPAMRDIEAMLSAVLKRDGRDGMVGALNMGGFPIRGAGDGSDPKDVVTLEQVQQMIANAGVKTGTVHFITGNATPSGYVRANGQALSRTTYANLWAFAQSSGNLAVSEAAKTAGQYGPGNGTTTFTVPNLEADGGYFLRPISSGRGIGSVQQDEFKSHNHSVTLAAAGGHAHTFSTRGGESSTGTSQVGSGWSGGTGTATTSSVPNHTHSASIGSSGGDETRPKNIAYPVIIKT